MKKRLIAMVLAGMTLVAGSAGCSSSDIYYDPVKDTLEESEVQVFLDDGLSKVMEKLAEDFNKEHPNVTITYTADSSENLASQIEEGSACDLFFSLTEENMDQLEEKGLLEGASMVENCTMENERVYPHFADLREPSGYFSVVLVEDDKS